MKKKKTKILMYTVTSILFDARIQKEAKTLKDSGFEVTILSIEDQESELTFKNLDERWATLFEELNGVNVIPMKLFSRNFKKYRFIPDKLFQAFELFFKFLMPGILKKYDFYHCHDLLPGIFALISSKLRSGSLIYDAHELELNQIAELQSGKLLYNIFNFYEKLVVANSKACITVNSSIAEIMQKMYGKHVYVIENKPEYVDIERRQIYKESKIILPKDKKIVMYAGLLSIERGLDKMVYALKYLEDDIVFAILGVGRINEFKEYIYSICNNQQIDNSRVIFIEPVSPKLVPFILNKADVSILLYQTGDSENNQINTPNKLFQSIIARVPILASNNITFNHHIFNNGFGPIGETVNESEPQEIAEKVNLLLDKDNNNRYRINAKEYSLEVTWRNEGLKLIEIYKSIS